MQGGKQPTKAQQDWQNWQRAQGCVNCGAHNPSIHHCVGSTAKHNKVHIGQWWTLPLCYECHQGDEGIHKNMKRFYVMDMPREYNRKQIEKRLFKLMVADYIRTQRKPPMEIKVINTIMDYHR